jgi:transposase-like protein
MGHRDSLYRLSGTIELDDAFIGGKHKGKRGRGAQGKTPVLIACENRQKKAGFIAMKAVNAVNFKKVDEWLPWVHIAIGNLKTFLLGTFHGVTSKYLQEYLNEFCYRFNRRFVEKQIPNRLLNLAIIHMPFKST